MFKSLINFISFEIDNIYAILITIFYRINCDYKDLRDTRQSISFLFFILLAAIKITYVYISICNKS